MSGGNVVYGEIPEKVTPRGPNFDSADGVECRRLPPSAQLLPPPRLLPHPPVRSRVAQRPLRLNQLTAQDSQIMPPPHYDFLIKVCAEHIQFRLSIRAAHLPPPPAAPSHRRLRYCRPRTAARGVRPEPCCRCRQVLLDYPVHPESFRRRI